MCIRDSPSTYIQTHLSENLGEIESVLSLCPGHADYLEVYERAGLLTDRSIFGHCVHLTDREYKRLGETGGIIAVSYTHLDVYKRQPPCKIPKGWRVRSSTGMVASTRSSDA